MAGVMIGVDPHKASRTAVAVSGDERPLGQVRVRASAVQARRLADAVAKRSYSAGRVEWSCVRHSPASVVLEWSGRSVGPGTRPDPLIG